MIVFTSAFAISSAATAYPLTTPRIGYQTYIRDLALQGTAVTVSSELPEALRDAPLRPDTVDYWQGISFPVTYLIDFGTTVDIDYVGLVGNLGSCGATARIDADTSATPTTQFATDVLPADDGPLMFIDTLRTIRYLKLTLTGSSLVPKIFSIYVGQLLKMPYGVYGGHTPITLSRQTELQATMTRGGQFVTQTYRRMGVKTTANFKNLKAAWYRTNFDPFVKAARRYPYFWSWRPADYPREVGYVWTPNDIAPVNQGVKDFMTVSVPMVGIGNE